MAHSVTFQDFGGFLLTEKEVIDFLELFYRWGDSKFLIRTDEKERKFRGEHRVDLAGHHTITLVKKNITRDFTMGIRVGGNHKAPTLQVAAGMVLAHEIQHANQHKLHGMQEGFFRSHRYWNRACERDARQFVDERLSEICAYFGAEVPQRRKVSANGDASEEALAVAALLGECEEVTMEDVKDELRESKILTPSNVRAVMDELKRQGFQVRTR